MARKKRHPEEKVDPVLEGHEPSVRMRTVRMINPPANIDEVQFAGLFRTGVYSNRALAAEFQISESFVRKLAKRLELTKDLSGQVRATVQDNVLRAVVRSESDPRTDEEIVADAAERGTAVVLRHCKSLARLRKTADMLSEQLDFAVTRGPELKLMLTESEPGARDGLLRKLVSLPTNAGIAKDLAAVYQTIIRVERQALGLDDAASSGTSFDETVLRLSAIDSSFTGN